ncbi:hypothetical protein ENUP19_0275G0032 [Entamoeba nuttalli]|uniref:Uncharacterized protein n=2 Tax=Entamoeba nuttalli TaxID=412467 RepID=K2GXD4_ENTNP|nr:hypothetical protein ENU1_110960 [Entamoeba nuttalli P19]EKE39903.1 hypothetical protein ENU1_110960 [Entamoeba nuttalli P19]|eukprot:XP_008857762.1 hypothetical protein ENU1_110960 [Entamoeba nuttalli P19]
MDNKNVVLLMRHSEPISSTFMSIAKYNKRQPFKIDLNKYNIKPNEQQQYQTNSFYINFKNIPPILVVHNLLNYGVGCKRDFFIKVKNRFEKSRIIKPVKFECGILSSENECANVLFKIINRAYNIFNQFDFSNKTSDDVQSLLNSLTAKTINQRPFIFMLNDIDTPFLLNNQKYFLHFLPRIISSLPNCRFILNTNTIDGPYLFSLSELLQMRMVLNSVVGEKWAPNIPWFRDYIPTVIQAKKKTREKVRMEIFKKLNTFQKNICITLVDTGNTSESALLDSVRIKFGDIPQSSFSQALKRLKEVGIVSTENGLVSLQIKKSKIQDAFSLI